LSTRWGWQSGCARAEEIGAYLLEALEPAEADEFRRHLEVCAHCRAELEQLAPAIELIAGSVERLEAPAELKRRVLERVEPASARPSSPARRLPRFAVAPRLATVGVAVAVAVALSIGLSGGGGRVRTIRAQVVPSLRGATVALREEGSRGKLVVNGLPALTGGRVYEVWVAAAHGEPQPAGVLSTVRSGTMVVPIRHTLRGIREVMVTAEPHGGTLRPTGAPLVTADL